MFQLGAKQFDVNLRLLGVDVVVSAA